MAPGVTDSPPPMGTGFQKQPSDSRDWLYKPDFAKLRTADAVDLRNTHKVQREPYNQGGLGSCTANAICEALRYAYSREQTVRNPPWYPSRLFLYWLERIALGIGEVPEPEQLQPFLDGRATSVTTASKSATAADINAAIAADRGAYIRDGMKILNKYGICSEKTWPYPEWPDKLYADDWTKFWKTFTTSDKYLKPPKGAMAEAPVFISQTFSYERIKDVYDNAGGIKIPDDSLWPGPNKNEKWTMVKYIEAALTEGFPVVFGFSGVGNHFFNLPAPYIFDGTIPDGIEEGNTFGHAVTIVGFDSKKKLFTILNSWGGKNAAGENLWGDAGYFYMRYEQFEATKPTYTVTRADKSVQTYGRVADLWVLKMKAVSENKTDRLLPEK